jgi:hypothetical protein
LLRKGDGEQLNLVREVRYTIGTLAVKNGRQLHAVPHHNPGKSLDDNDAFDRELNSHREFHAEGFPLLKQVADEVIRAQKLEDESQLIRAIALRNELFASGKYQYSLQFEMPRVAAANSQPAVDPLEHFVSASRKGHCEFFASALVMMLRSQGIPARLVVGYKGGDWNAVGHYYLIRQKHAHAWVEVLLTADQVPGEEVAGKPSGSGAWYRLDPTPPSIEELAEQANLTNRVHDIFDYADYLWRDYVLGLNSGRQDKVLEPLTNRSRDILPGALDATAWQRWLRQSWRTSVNAETTAEALKPATAGPPWLSYALLLGLVIAAPAALGGGLLLGKWLWQRRPGPASSAVNHAPDFFVELTRILARRGIKVPRQATARELASLAADRLVLPAAVLDQIVACYHRVRFGGVPLSRHEQNVVTHALSQIRQAHQQTASSPAT